MDELTEYEKALRTWAKHAVIETTSSKETPNIVDHLGKFRVRKRDGSWARNGPEK